MLRVYEWINNGYFLRSELLCTDVDPACGNNV